MDPSSNFKAERKAVIEAYGKDTYFRELSMSWRAESMAKRYVYNFDWLGRPIIQYPQDIIAIQELIWTTKPTLIIETGIAHGGSLILSASMLAMLDLAEAIEAGAAYDARSSKRKVVGIDIDIRSHNRAEIQSHPMFNWIELIDGSSIDKTVVSQVARIAGEHEHVMVCLDSMHTHDHVLAELAAYAPLVSKGFYCVVFDTFIEDMPPKFIANRPWDVGDNPKTAVHQWVAENPDFEIDKMLDQRLQVTAAPDGFLRRIS